MMPKGSAPVTTVRVRALFFASYRELVGVEELELELAEGSSVDSLIDLIRGERGIVALPESPVVAVNQEYAPLDTPLSDGDEVAFIPPVAGG